MTTGIQGPILLTGASGFLGSHIFNKMQSKNVQILPVGKSKKENQDALDLTAYGDIAKYISKNKPRIVIHAAGYVNLERSHMVGTQCFSVNTMGTFHLLEAIKNIKPALFIYVSTEEVYGDGPLPFSEEQVIHPPSPYAISKASAEYLCNWYAKEYNIPVCVVRFSTMYGPKMPANKYFSQVILHAINNEPILTNSGRKKRDYLYISDAVDLIFAIILQRKKISARSPVVVNAGGGVSYSLSKIIEEILRFLHSSSLVQFDAIPDRVTEKDEWLANIKKAKEIFGWEPDINIQEGLRKTVQSFL